MKKCVFLMLIAWVPQLMAAHVDAELGLLQGTLSTASDYKVSRSLNTFGIYAQITKAEANNGFLVGWNITSVTNKDQMAATTDQTLTSTDMGPAIQWYYDKNLIYSITYVYGIVCKGKYKTSTTEEDITGASSIVKFSAMGRISEAMLLGAALSSYSATYTKSTVSSVQTDIGYKNSWLFPSVVLSFKF